MGEGTRDVSLNETNSNNGVPTDGAANARTSGAAPETTYSPATGVENDSSTSDRAGLAEFDPSKSEIPESDTSMNTTSNDGTPAGDDEANLSVDELKERIEQTRNELTGTVDAIQDRLDPERIKAQVREATIGKVQETVHSAGEKAQAVAGVVKEKAQALAAAASEKAQEAAAAHKEKSEQAALDGASATAGAESSATASEQAHDWDPKGRKAAEAAATPNKIEAAKSFVQNNPVPVALGAASAVALWLWRRRVASQYVIEYDEYDIGID
jgi:hypothetical protein